MMKSYVSRHLAYNDDQGTTIFISERELCEQPLPAIVLGDPGMGKSELLLKLAESDGYHYLTAAQFLRRPLDRLPRGVLLLDALDEVAAGKDSDPLDRLLARLAEADCPDFILTCRAADWHGSIRSHAIKLDYGHPVRILTLQALSDEES